MFELAVLAATTVASPVVSSMQPLRPLPPAVQTGDTVRHFAYGSNLLLSKLVNRGANGTTIEVLGREAASVVDHRLAFNLRMFPPLEPAMASIEPSAGEDCEGALYTLTRQGYDELWKSEGGAMERPGYEELVVTAEACGESVQAITLRAASARKLKLAQPAAALVVWPAVAALPTTRHASHVAGAVDAPGSRRAAERPVQEAHRRRRQRGDPQASA